MDYKMEMINDHVLAPLIVQMALYSAIEASERTMGLRVFGFAGRSNSTADAAGSSEQRVYGRFQRAAASLTGTAIPLAYVLQSGFDALKLKGIQLEVESFDRKKEFKIDQVWASAREAHPGDKVELTTVLAGENGAELTRKLSYTVPVGAPPGHAVLHGSRRGIRQPDRISATADHGAAYTVAIGVVPERTAQER